MNAPQGTQAVTRAVGLLRTVASLQRSGASLSRIALATSLSRSTAFRLLRCLTEERLLRFDQSRRSYFVGPLAFELGLAAQGPSALADQWAERIRQVSERTGLTTYLVARSDTDVVCLDTAHATAAVRAVPLDVGERLPLGIGAGSLAILSSLPDDEVEALIEVNGSRLQVRTDGRLTPQELRRRIALTRDSGFAYSRESVARGIVGIGILAPRRDELTQVAISVSMVGTTLQAIEQRRLADTIRSVADA